MTTNVKSIIINYSAADLSLFSKDQWRHFNNIEKHYKELLPYCLDEVEIPVSVSHKTWIKARVNLHTTTSIRRLLYLVESFRESVLNFNLVAASVQIKAMVEIPLHLGYLVWILSEHNNFYDIKNELSKIAFGNRDRNTGLTVSSKIRQKTFYMRSDEMIKKHFKNEPITINIFKILYKEANATGHHNYEGRNMLVGLQKNNTWYAKDRKELFVFYSNNIFQIFLHCDAILGMSLVFLKAIDHYLKQLPENFANTKQKNNEKFIQKIVNYIKNWLICRKR